MPDLATACVLVTIVLRLASGTEATVPQDQQPSVSRALSTSALQWLRMPPPPALSYVPRRVPYYIARGLNV